MLTTLRFECNDTQNDIEYKSQIHEYARYVSTPAISTLAVSTPAVITLAVSTPAVSTLAVSTPAISIHTSSTPAFIRRQQNFLRFSFVDLRLERARPKYRCYLIRQLLTPGMNGPFILSSKVR